MNTPSNKIAPHSIKCDLCSLSSLCLPYGLSEQEVEELEASIEKSIKIKKNQYVFRANDQHEGIFAVKAGAIKTSLANGDGQEQVVAFHLPGDIFGFDAFNSGAHVCNSIALDDTLLCKINLENFEDLCDRFSGIRKAMFNQAGKKITNNQSLLLSLGQQQTDERFAAFLLKIAAHYESRGYSSKEFNLPMPRQDLSNYLGMAVETLSRIIARMSDSDIVEVTHRHVLIKDKEKLSEVAHSSCSS